MKTPPVLSFVLLSLIGLLGVLPISVSGGEPSTSRNLPPCCRKTLESGSVTDKSLYQLESLWTSDVRGGVQLGVLRGRPQVVAMFFTHCEYACPILVHELKRLEAALPENMRDHVDFLLVSFDSDRDQATVLGQYRGDHELSTNHWTLLTGRPDDVRELAALLGVNYQRDARGQFSHSNLITVLNQEGEVARQFSGLQLPLTEVLSLLETLASKHEPR